MSEIITTNDEAFELAHNAPLAVEPDLSIPEFLARTETVVETSEDGEVEFVQTDEDVA